MVQHVIDATTKLGAAQVHLVYGPRWRVVKTDPEKDDKLNWVLQAEQLGNRSRNAAGRALLLATMKIF